VARSRQAPYRALGCCVSEAAAWLGSRHVLYLSYALPSEIDDSPRLKPGDSCFIGTCQLGRGPHWSYRLSTGIHRASHGKHVLRGVDIPVVPDPALWTRPLPYIKWQRVEDVPTGMAALGTGIPAVDPDQGPPVPVRFVFQLADQLAPAHVTHALGQRGIAHHI